MIRLKISNFIRKHKDKIKDLIQKLSIVAVGVFIATIILSSLSSIIKPGKIQTEDNIKEVYKPTDTIIAGSNVSKEQYEKDSNVVNKFLEECNNGNVEMAYNLLTEECKEENYQTIEMFRKNYYDYIFDKKREVNLQSWISSKKYTIYKVRYANNMLQTGTYNEKNVAEDYLTLKKENNTEKISIGKFIDSMKCNVVTETNEIKATVKKIRAYVNDETYEIAIRNKTDSTILLNTLKQVGEIQLISKDKKTYIADINKIFLTDLTISPYEETTITLSFRKDAGLTATSEKINIFNIIKNYDKYKENPNEYNGFTEISINLEE